MDWSILLICCVAFLASLLSFFSGFGLGTILLPVFAIFFPIETAVLLTACVHFCNNLLKLGLVFRHIHAKLVWQFGLFSVAGAVAGAWLLQNLTKPGPILSYLIEGHLFEITLLKLIVGGLIITFTLLERMKLSFKPEPAQLATGGLLSGFFGGLSGHQGALRSAFLSKLDLSPAAFIANGVIIACLVDVTRLGFYAKNMDAEFFSTHGTVLILAMLSAFSASLLGKQFLKKVNDTVLHNFVTVLLILLGSLLMAGIL